MEEERRPMLDGGRGASSIAMISSILRYWASRLATAFTSKKLGFGRMKRPFSVREKYSWICSEKMPTKFAAN
jgi:hypothetical protein